MKEEREKEKGNIIKERLFYLVFCYFLYLLVGSKEKQKEKKQRERKQKPV